METVEVAEFESHADAEAETVVLREHGIPFDLQEEGARVVVTVPQPHAATALSLLFDEEENEDPALKSGIHPCPECGSPETQSLTGRAAFILVVILAGAIAVLSAGYQDLGLLIVALGGPLAAWFGRDLGNRLCLNCGWKYRADRKAPLST